LTHRMGGEKCQILGDRAFDPLRFHGGVQMLPRGQRRLLPFDCPISSRCSLAGLRPKKGRADVRPNFNWNARGPVGGMGDRIIANA
jgi:hypothetical protein